MQTSKDVGAVHIRDCDIDQPSTYRGYLVTGNISKRNRTLSLKCQLIIGWVSDRYNDYEAGGISFLNLSPISPTEMLKIDRSYFFAIFLASYFPKKENFSFTIVTRSTFPISTNRDIRGLESSLLLSGVCSLCVLGNCNSPLVAERDVEPSNAVILPIYEVTTLIATTNRQTDTVSFLKRTIVKDDNLTSVSISRPLSLSLSLSLSLWKFIIFLNDFPSPPSDKLA